MWDESVILSINYFGEGCFVFLKFNFQFLIFYDYFFRNFNFFCLEFIYEICEDIQEVVLYLFVYINNEGEIVFCGWL